MFAEDHNPPHIHVKYGNYQITITIEKETVKGDIPDSVLKKTTAWLNIHRQELMKNWELLQNGEQANKIEPLI